VTLKLNDKKVIVTDVAKVATSAVSALVADYRGLTVAEMTELRAKARKAGIYLRVVRNTLARRALENTSFACLDEVLVGPTFLALSLDDPGAAARLMRDFAKEHEKIQVKGLALGGKLFTALQLNAIADLPSRDQAIAMLMSVMLAPITKLVRTLAEPYAKLTRTFAALGEQKKSA
jgi:large subunit ribosomal protein L10